MLFQDRSDAGRRLAARLQFLRDADVVVLGLPRGGVPVAFEVARALGAPLDVIVVRKLGVPYQPELAFGAIGENGVHVRNDHVVERAGLSGRDMEMVESRERAELSRRIERYRHGRSRIPLRGRTVVIVDDGIATGATARAACRVARAQDAARVVLATPVAARDALAELRGDTDEVICLAAPRWFLAVGQWYRRFAQTGDDEVADLLRRAAAESSEPQCGTAADPPVRDDEVAVVAGNVELAGRLTIPENPRATVVFAHGSGSSRHSPRNRYVAAELNRAGLGTLLFDLLTPAEELHRANVFDIGLLANRLVDVTVWLTRQHHAAGLPVGYFGASTGAAAALRAAADPRVRIAAVVSRGGRPDLADAALPVVHAPTLLIVGGHDSAVLELNRYARRIMSCETGLAVVPGATHLFTEPGALERVAELAREWFTGHLGSATGGRSARPGRDTVGS
jgi:predicted phosphoribosyltransferase/dienelactone hydrolase